MSLNKNCPKHQEGAMIAQRFRLLKNPITTFSVTILTDLKFLNCSNFELYSPNSRGATSRLQVLVEVISAPALIRRLCT